MFRIKCPPLASPCVELVCIHATYSCTTQHAGCQALSAVNLYSDAFDPGLQVSTRTNTRHTF